MAGDADEELLARLGVVAANPSDYERVLLSQVEQQAQEAAAEELAEQGGDDVTAAQNFLRENDPQFRTGKDRIREVLGTLESEIAAVTAAREAFDGPVSGDEKADAAETSSREGKRKGRTEDDGEAMHLALLDERLESLKRKRKSLRQKLKVLEKPRIIQESTEDASQVGRQKGQGSTPRTKKGTERSAAKPRVVTFVEDDDFDAALDDAASGFVETEREKLIRMGVITPFSKVDGFERRVRSRPSERPSANEEPEDELVKRSISNAVASMSAISKARPATRLLDSSELPKLAPPTHEFRQLRTPFKRVTADEADGKPVKSRPRSGVKRKRPQADKKWKKRIDVSSDDESDSLEDSKVDNLSVTDEDEPRKQSLRKRKRLRLANKANAGTEDGLINGREEQESLEDDEEEDVKDAVLEGGLKIPGAIYNKLFDYQKTGVKWMWELHCQKAGGIIGDEMGLGKTIQVIAFLAALHYSGLYKPSIVVCPVTLLRQWKREVKKWYPSFKAVILHDSAVKGRVKKVKKKKTGASEEAHSSDSEKEEEGKESDSEEEVKSSGRGTDRWTSMITSIVQSTSGLLITTYEQLRLNRDKLLDINWGYAVLDEGHRVRNPDAEVTLVCKQLPTVHRIIMTGAPIQNRLTELWSLFDFVFPGKLGVLPIFQAQFVLPIQIGGYANATPLQVSTAYKCAVVLRDLILPYLLRRMKADVHANLTKKTEHVLFCSLSAEQRAAYRAFLGSSEVEQIMEGNRNSLFGIDILRKICNHPDLLEREQGAGHPDYGNPERSGKLKLVRQILSLWKSQGHRVLLFTQTQQMLDIIQSFAEAQGYEYRRMDGSTAVKHRMALIDEFNESENVFLFILTTKVGGLGTNLTGANRVIIFDPDWNPSTDMQARERAWRIGQKKDVTIYRFITRGTIEEKVYHRQIFKHFLTNKILKDPQQRRIFKARDMRDLFTLQEDTNGDTKTETATLFGDDVGNLMLTDQENHLGKDAISCETNTRGRSSGQGGMAVIADQGTPSDDSDQKGKEKIDPAEGTQEEESRILKNLFEANGIHSAMDHDAILAVSDKEKVMVDQEAGRVAQRAADALRKSRMQRASDDIAVPTWTGRSGEAGAPAGLRRRFGSTTNSRLVAVSAVQTTTVSTVQGHVRSTQEVGIDFASASSRQGAAGAGAGIAAGKALTSSDVLSRMRERQMGALGAGLDSAYDPTSHRSNVSLSWRVPAVGSQAGQGSQSSGQVSEVSSAQPVAPFHRFGRGAAAVSTGAGQGSQSSAPQFGGGRGLIPSYFPGRGSEAPGGQSKVVTNRFGRAAATPPTMLGQASQAPASTSNGGRSLHNPAFSEEGSQVQGIQPEVLLADIRAFLQQNGGTVPSATIVEHFRSRISSKDLSLFRQLLKAAASLEKGAGEIPRWVLKSVRNGTL